jgi:hypothetical protein
MDDRTKKIMTLNDLARMTFLGCRVMITPGVQGMDDLAVILTKVRTFDTFTEDNDPYGEHDFGSFQHDDETLFWKIDYYDRTLTAGTEEASDPLVTTRFLTVMLASEYGTRQGRGLTGV